MLSGPTPNLPAILDWLTPKTRDGALRALHEAIILGGRDRDESLERQVEIARLGVPALKAIYEIVLQAHYLMTGTSRAAYIDELDRLRAAADAYPGIHAHPIEPIDLSRIPPTPEEPVPSFDSLVLWLGSQAHINKPHTKYAPSELLANFLSSQGVSFTGCGHDSWIAASGRHMFLPAAHEFAILGSSEFRTNTYGAALERAQAARIHWPPETLTTPAHELKRRARREREAREREDYELDLLANGPPPLPDY
jgi:hypothetical protein